MVKTCRYFCVLVLGKFWGILKVYGKAPAKEGQFLVGNYINYVDSVLGTGLKPVPQVKTTRSANAPYLNTCFLRRLYLILIGHGTPYREVADGIKTGQGKNLAPLTS